MYFENSYLRRLYPVLLCSLLTLFTQTALATSCGQAAMLDTIEFGRIEHIVSFRVLDYEDVDEGYPTYMDVEIIRQLEGHIEQKEIRIIGNNNGLSVRPGVTEFDIDNEWLAALEIIDGEYYLPGCSSTLRIENDTVIGYIRPCSQDPDNDYYCGDMTFANAQAFRTQTMTLAEFNLAREVYSEGIAKALRLCTGPSSRCENIRARYNPATGELILPAVDVVPLPGEFPLTYGIKARMRQQPGTTTFIVTDIER